MGVLVLSKSSVIAIGNPLVSEEVSETTASVYVFPSSALKWNQSESVGDCIPALVVVSMLMLIALSTPTPASSGAKVFRVYVPVSSEDAPLAEIK